MSLTKSISKFANRINPFSSHGSKANKNQSSHTHHTFDAGSSGVFGGLRPRMQDERPQPHGMGPRVSLSSMPSPHRQSFGQPVAQGGAQRPYGHNAFQQQAPAARPTQDPRPGRHPSARSHPAQAAQPQAAPLSREQRLHQNKLDEARKIVNAGVPKLNDFFEAMHRHNEREQAEASNPYNSGERYEPDFRTYDSAISEHEKALKTYKNAVEFLKHPYPQAKAEPETISRPKPISRQEINDAKATVMAGAPGRFNEAAIKAESDYYGHTVSSHDAQKRHERAEQRYNDAVSLLQRADAQGKMHPAKEDFTVPSRRQELREKLEEAEGRLKEADKKNYNLQMKKNFGETPAEREAAAKELEAFKPERQKIINWRNDMRAKLADMNRPTIERAEQERERHQQAIDAGYL